MEKKFDSVDILGVRVDKVTLEQTLSQVEGWLAKEGRYYIVTPNVEFIMKAQEDPEFRQILNQADLAIPDSSRFGWASREMQEKKLLKRVLILPFSILPTLLPGPKFPVTTGVDLMEKICEQSAVLGFTIGFLGGRDGVAKKAAECLKKKYPRLKVVFAEAGPEVGEDGADSTLNTLYSIPLTDILFVAFGQGKQEKWIAKNLPQIPVKIAIGVGGSFNYLSGRVFRAPGFLRKLGLEWLFRLVLQPWRVKRQTALVKFVFLILTR